MPLYRLEKDSLGSIEVPKEAYWGAQTQRSLEHFPLRGEILPLAFIKALGWVKEAAALTNYHEGKLNKKI